MIIAGAGGHARELIGVLAESGQLEGLCLFDDVTLGAPPFIWDRFPVVRKTEDLKKALSTDPRFIIGVGSPAARRLLYEKLSSLGGVAYSLVSPFARIGAFNVDLGEGLNIMTGAVISQDVSIGKGSLIHMNATIHHDCRIGEFCEVSPGCHLLGKVNIGNMTAVGAGAIVLPGLTVGDGCVIGAGAVVSKNLAPGSKVKGVPAK